MAAIFEGLKVVELASVLAGPAVGMFFAELGAEVIKIENSRTGGDVTRSWKLPSEDSGLTVSAYFSSINYGKQHLLLNLRNPEELQRVHTLISKADVVIANFKAGDGEKLSLDYEYLKTLNPSLIYAALTGFDSEPERVAYDVVLQAECGYTWMNGTPDGPPVKMPLALMDILAAHQLKEGVLCALLQRERNRGIGGKVEVSLEAAALASLANQATNWLMAGHVPQRMGSLHPNIAPYGEQFQTKDERLLVLAVGSSRQFDDLCNCLGLQETAKDQRFSTNADRVKNRNELFAALAPAIQKRDRDELLPQLHALKVPAAAIRPMNEVMESPTAKKMLLKEEIDGQETVRMASVAFRLSD